MSRDGRSSNQENSGLALGRAGLGVTEFGYFLRDLRACSDPRSRCYEIAMAFTGTIVAVAVVGLLLLPALDGRWAQAETQLPISFLLLSLAGLLMRNSSRGRHREAEVDFEQGELRLMRRNARGHVRVEQRIPFDNIASIFVRRDKTPGLPSKLCLRREGSETALELLRGPEAEMSVLHQRLVRDLSGLRAHRATAAAHARRANLRVVADAA